MTNDEIGQVIHGIIRTKGPAVVFTGAGMSEESGIPTFRARSALWEKYNPEECCTVEALEENPEKVWALVDEMRDACEAAEPNEGHKVITELQKLELVSSIITQNVDGLHQRAGSKNVLEIHGDLLNKPCSRFGTRMAREGTNPRECHCCGEIMRPNLVLFGDPLPEAFDQAMALTNTCKMMIIVGTSGMVEPAATIPMIAGLRGIPVIEINPEPAGFAPPNFTLAEKASVGLKRLL
jgi:NAD-dependent deacetylase